MPLGDDAIICAEPVGEGRRCGRPPQEISGRQGVCILHLQNIGKDVNRFQKEIDAILATTCDFSFVRFPDFSFADREFPHAVSFDNATFLGLISFSGAKFLSSASFVQTQFQRGADFTDVVFSGRTSFGKAGLNKKTDFTRARFEQTTEFSDTSFSGKVTFEDALFEKEGDFSRMSVSGPIGFQGCTFNREALFSKVQFGSPTRFEMTVFRGDTNFEKARFGPETTFAEAKFERGCSFGSATFGGAADFTDASWRSGANFQSARFDGSAHFLRSVFGPSAEAMPRSRPVKARFKDVEFANPVSVRFIEVNLNCSIGFSPLFGGCNVTEVSFEGVRWHRAKGRIWLDDERLAREVVKRSSIPLQERSAVCDSAATTYRRLTTNFEDTRQTDHAEDCFWGSMEMKRLDPDRAGLQWFALRAYSAASKYGSSYRRAVGVLFGIIVGFGIFFALPSSDLQLRAEHAVGKPSALSESLSVARPVIRGVLHSLEVATFNRDMRYIPRSAIGHSIQILESILVPAQAALLLLALRRRFKR